MKPFNEEKITKKRSRMSLKIQDSNNFPAKLHYVLEAMKKEDQQDIMGWQPHGRAFVVRDKNRLVSQILPAWFRQSQFPSFQRQLNLYGFIRIYKGPDHGAYYHPCFLRDQPMQAHAMKRVPIKGTGRRLQGKERPIPNFYEKLDGKPQPLTTLTQVSCCNSLEAPINHVRTQPNDFSIISTFPDTLFTAPLQAHAVSRLTRLPDTLDSAASVILANRNATTARLPSTHALPLTIFSPQQPIHLHPAALSQQRTIDACLVELAALSSIQQQFFDPDSI